METSPTDRIEKTVPLQATPSRVWRALANAQEFGTWFGLRLDGPFEVGRSVTGHILHPGYEKLSLELAVERMEPETFFSYRWHPYAVDAAVDYSKEPMTLVEFRIEPAARGCVLHITESGFDKIPLARRAEAFRMNDGGWTAQATSIGNHVSAR